MPNKKREPKITDCFVSIVAPVYNQEGTIATFVKDVSEILRGHYANYELIIVDNGSDDETIGAVLPLLKTYPCIRVVRLSRNYLGDISIFAGLEASIGDYVVVMLPDIDPPKLIPKVITQLRAGSDMVQGVDKKWRDASIISRLGRMWFFRYSRRAMQVDIPVNATYLIGMNRRLVNSVTHIKGQYRHIRPISSQLGYRRTTITYEPNHKRQRTLGEAIDLSFEIAISYSNHPLRFVSKIGLLAAILNVIYGLYTLVVYIFKSDVVQGWTTLSLQMAGMFFFVFLLLSVLSEYVGRILEETRARPSYHIMEELVSTVLIADETRRNVTTSSKR